MSTTPVVPRDYSDICARYTDTDTLTTEPDAFPFDRFPDAIKLEVFTWTIAGAIFDATNRYIQSPLAYTRGMDVDATKRLSRTANTLASVSSSWRDIMLAFGSLWSTVTIPIIGFRYSHDIDPVLDNVKRQIARSKKHTLHIILILQDVAHHLLQDHSKLWEVIRLVWAEIPRWRSYTVAGDSSHIASKFWDGVAIPTGAKLLTHLTLDSTTTTRWLSAGHSPLDHCKSLSLVLRDFNIPIGSSTTFSNITDVNIRLLSCNSYSETNNTTILNTFRLLAFVPNVQRLTMHIPDNSRLSCDVWRTGPLVDHKFRVKLHHLQVWHMFGCDHSSHWHHRNLHFDYEPFLPTVHAPALTDLLIQQPAPRTLFRFLNDSQCNLHSLSICIRPDIPMYKLKRHLDSLTGSVQTLHTLAVYALGSHRSTVLVRELCDDPDLLPNLKQITLQVLNNTITEQTSAIPSVGFDFADNIIPLLNCRKRTLQRVTAHITTSHEDLLAVKDAIVKSGVVGVYLLHYGSRCAKLDTHRDQEEFVEDTEEGSVQQSGTCDANDSEYDYSD